MDDRTLDFLFHHVFLSSRLPSSNDIETGIGDRALVDRLVQCASRCRDLVDPQYYQQWSKACRTLRTFSSMHRNNTTLTKLSLRSACRDVEDGDIVILHIATQNSALMLRREGNQYLFETFETSHPAAKVLAAKNALQWDFPSRAAAIPSSTFEKATFQASLSDFIEKASVEPVKQYAAVSRKADSNAYESRDTPTPAIIGQLLMAILEANGHGHNPKLTRKRIHDEVCWDDGAQNPWRRSARWLVLRVGLQRSLCNLLGGRLGTLHYKFLIALVHVSIAEDFCTQNVGSSDRLAFAKTKLARWIAKLETLRFMVSPQDGSAVQSLFETFSRDFDKVLTTLEGQNSETWIAVRRRLTKRVAALPRRADITSKVLSLDHTRQTLHMILDEALYGTGRRSEQVELQKRTRVATALSAWANAQAKCSLHDYLDLANYESKLQSRLAHAARDSSNSDSEKSSAEVLEYMRFYQPTALIGYAQNPEQLSLMLLLLMETWQALDSTTLSVFPLLRDYDVPFHRDLLHCLQLYVYEDLVRLQAVEYYLADRKTNAKNSLPSIYGDFSDRSFGVRYFDQCQEMQDLWHLMEAEDTAARTRKEQEWAEKSTEYEDTRRSAASAACLFTEDERDPLRRVHNDRHCQKCSLAAKARKMRIQIHEAILPETDMLAKTIIFELLLPPAFASWREGTWQLAQLGRAIQMPGRVPYGLLQDYSKFKPYFKSTDSVVGLASQTKSFLKTHYSQVPFPTMLEQIFLPHGLKYVLYDRKAALWTSRQSSSPSFVDLCSPSLIAKSVPLVLRKSLHPTLERMVVTANDIVAAQTRCPNTLSVTEFTTFQDLRLGTSIQWIRLLRELASSNLNFGSACGLLLVTVLAATCGPPDGDSPLRAIHWVFRDESFCSALATQVRRRLESIEPNWREGQTAECLLVISNRLWSMVSGPKSRREAEELLQYMRKITYNWVSHLRREIYKATDIETAQRRSQDAILSALICRKTFIMEAAHPTVAISKDALTCYLECSFTLKDNLPKHEPAYIAKMSAGLRKLFIADIKLLEDLQPPLRLSISTCPEAVDVAVNNVWAETEGVTRRRFTQWKFLPVPQESWITAKTTANGCIGQDIHVDTLEGTLLIERQVIGRLPQEYAKQPFFHRLFGDRVFLTYPSFLPGMSYMFATLFEKHEIHFGFRNGLPIVRVRNGNSIFEYIPETLFAGPPGSVPDLPLPIVNDCVHWLDLASASVVIRPLATTWAIMMLDVKTQLIYPSGSQQVLDGHPGRWQVTQEAFKIVKLHLGLLRRKFPRGIEVIDRERGSFPTIYLLKDDVKQDLIRRVTDSILQGEGGILPIQDCSNEESRLVSKILREPHFPKSEAPKIASALKARTDTRQRLLLLRGLLVHKILLMGLGKRWNVHYGTDPRRDPIAVPYRNKGIPCDQVEFGHPDVSIILTCLSFYYSGLNLAQLRQNLGRLLKSDEPATEFELWIQSVGPFPESLRSWSALNMEDETQCSQLWSLLRYQMIVINHFMNHFVFPRYARTFEQKLVSSGWDISVTMDVAASASSSGPVKAEKENARPDKSTVTASSGGPIPLTVGFSGTNDNKALLPLNIVQNDLPALSHTNAEVLTYLLQPRNRKYYPATDRWGKRIPEREMLRMIKDIGARMLLDAGAQILELDNVSFARTWLENETEAEAAVYFGDDEKARVVYRDGKNQPLAGSPLLNNLASCVVYLDQAHVRGVDLKMPADAKAALTLGIMQTKDHTVQAAMRLRQLATTQSVVFFAPPEVHQSIMNLCKKTGMDKIDSSDVIIWLLEQTCCNIEQLQLLYVSQGIEYCRQRLAALRNTSIATDVEQRKAYLKVLEQPEQYSLEKLYAPEQRPKVRPIDAGGNFEIANFIGKLNAMKEGMHNTGDTVQALAHQEVEQEREVQIETEAKEIRSFAKTGRLAAGSQACQQIFVILRQTALGRRLGITDSATGSSIFATSDFANTILWSSVTETALVLSDFEADAVLPLTRDKVPVSTYLLTYAAPVNRHMLHFDSLKFFSVPQLPKAWRAPTWLVRDLGIFAGRLYFDYDSQYNAVCHSLGLLGAPASAATLSTPFTELDLWRELPFAEAQAGFAKEEEPFSPNPLVFIQEWLANRRKGQDFAQTMMGELCRGRKLITEVGGGDCECEEMKEWDGL